LIHPAYITNGLGGKVSQSLQNAFESVYDNFKLHFYKRVFQRLESREASLTLVETYSIEVINALDAPTVSEFAKFLNISTANATYKVQSLIKKGYLRKERSEEDRRESRLIVTERFHEYAKLSSAYVSKVVGRIEETCSQEDLETLQRVLETIATDLMPEVRE